jgi:hypothetical protein
LYNDKLMLTDWLDASQIDLCYAKRCVGCFVYEREGEVSMRLAACCAGGWAVGRRGEQEEDKEEDEDKEEEEEEEEEVVVVVVVEGVAVVNDSVREMIFAAS